MGPQVLASCTASQVILEGFKHVGASGPELKPLPPPHGIPGDRIVQVSPEDQTASVAVSPWALGGAPHAATSASCYHKSFSCVLYSFTPRLLCVNSADDVDACQQFKPQT